MRRPMRRTPGIATHLDARLSAASRSRWPLNCDNVVSNVLERTPMRTESCPCPTGRPLATSSGHWAADLRVYPELWCSVCPPSRFMQRCMQSTTLNRRGAALAIVNETLPAHERYGCSGTIDGPTPPATSPGSPSTNSDTPRLTALRGGPIGQGRPGAPGSCQRAGHVEHVKRGLREVRCRGKVP